MSDGAGPADLGIPGLVDVTELKSGPVATTYRARDEMSGRTVIVKVLIRPLDAQEQERFDHEQSQIQAASDHPNIVTVYGHGTTATGLAYVVNEDVPGGAIRDRIAASGPLSGPDILQLGIRLAGALETAHRARVLHGDIRPDDVLTSTYGDALLSDFGLAVLVSPAASSITDVDRLANVAPELLDGARPAPASDVYALSSTLFTLLAGHPAYLRPGDTSVVGVVKRIAFDPVPNLQAEGVPEPVQAVLARGMAKDPAQRIGSAEELGRALQQAQVTLGLPMTEMTVLGGTAAAAAGAPTTAVPQATAAFPTVAAAPGPPTGPPPGPMGPPPGGPPPPPPPGQKSKAPLAIIGGLVALLVIGGLAFALLGGGDDDDDAEPRTTTTTEEEDDPDDTTTTTEEEPETTTTTIEEEPEPEPGGTDPTEDASVVFALPAGTPYSAAEASLTDETGRITVTVPGEWTETALVPSDDGNPAIEAAPQLQPFREGFDVPGMQYAATTEAGGEDLETLLDAADPGGCTEAGGGTYTDPVFEGVYELLSDCGRGTTGIVTIAARNSDASVTVLLLIQLVSDADLVALDRILDTFNTTGDF